MVNLHIVPKLILATVFGLGILGPANATAQTSAVTVEKPFSLRRLLQDDWSFWPTDDRGRTPRRTTSGSTRNPNCVSNPLRPLTPDGQVGRTSQARPDILLYVPAATPRQAIFAIQAGNDFYHTVPITLPDTAGIVSLPLPAEIPDLAADEQYQWSLVLICHDEARPDSPIISRWLETQTRLSEAHLRVNPSLEQAARYRDGALWYDMIAMLAQLKSGHPDDDVIHQAWLSVLERHQLEDLSDEPLVR